MITEIEHAPEETEFLQTETSQPDAGTDLRKETDEDESSDLSLVETNALMDKFCQSEPSAMAKRMGAAVAHAKSKGVSEEDILAQIRANRDS